MADLKLLIMAIVIAVIGTSASPAFAQDPQVPRKIDEFIGELDTEDLIARLDNFAAAVQSEPNAQAQIIVYRSRRDPPDVSYEYGLLAKKYLVNVRHIDRTRLVTLDGGMSGCLTYELWIVPLGAAPPARRFTYRYPLKRRFDNRSRRSGFTRTHRTRRGTRAAVACSSSSFLLS
jgi:hypothetical protein